MTASNPRWEPQPASDLPDGLILFDGVCVLCSGWVNFVIRRDPAARFRFVAIQSPPGRQLATRFGIDPAEPESNAVIAGGAAYFKLDSALAVVAHFPRWGWTQALYVLPRPLRNFLYDRIARNRYRLFGRHDSCLIPTPAIRARFLSDDCDLAENANLPRTYK